MGRGWGLLRFPRLTPSPTPMPSRYASLDGGKEDEPSDSPLSSSLEDWCRKEEMVGVVQEARVLLFI